MTDTQRTAKLVGGEHDGLVVQLESNWPTYSVPSSQPGGIWVEYERTGQRDAKGNEIFTLARQSFVAVPDSDPKKSVPDSDRERQWRELREAVDDFKAKLWDHRRDFFFLWLGMMIGGLAQWLFG